MTPETPASILRVSVALCTCNGEKFLREQLDSIANQSRPVDEIVICDDESTDGTSEIVRLFAAASPTVKWIENPTRLGVTKNFEKAISLCTGDIIFPCDQDDCWVPDKVQILLDAIQNKPAALAFSNAEMIDAKRSPLGYRLWDSIWFDADEQRRMRAGDAVPVLLRHAVAAGSTLAFRSEFLPLLLPIPDLPHSHDIWITLLLACVDHIQPVDRDLIQYRLHDRNEVGMRQFGLFDQIRMARQQIETDIFAYLRDLHAAAHQRLTTQTRYPVAPAALQLLQEKINHSQIRHGLPSQWTSRLATVVREIQQRNYRKYSYGYKSVLQDLFLR